VNQTYLILGEVFFAARNTHSPERKWVVSYSGVFQSPFYYNIRVMFMKFPKITFFVRIELHRNDFVLFNVHLDLIEHEILDERGIV